MNTVMISNTLLQIAPYATNLASLYTVTCTINGLMSGESEDKVMTDYLIETDIDETIKTCKSLLSEIPHTDSKTVKQCIEHIKITINLIEKELAIIYHNLSFNQSLCFLTRRVRSYSFKENIATLSKLIKILNHRNSELERASHLLNISRSDENKNKELEKPSSKIICLAPDDNQKD